MEFSTVILFLAVVAIIAYAVVKKRKASDKDKNAAAQNIACDDVIAPYIGSRTVNRIHGVVVVSMPPISADVPFGDDLDIVVEETMNETLHKLALDGKKPFAINSLSMPQGAILYIMY